MKKFLLVLSTVFLVSSIMAQEVEIFYPDLRYDTNRGFTKYNIEIGDVESNLWKRGTSGLPAEADLGYTRTGDQTLLSSKAYGDVGATYGITDTYAVIDAVNLTTVPAEKHIKVTFFTMAQYGLANFSKFTVLLTSNFTGDPTTTEWTDVTSQLDQIDDDVNYDSNWTKSTLDLNAWRNEDNLVLAFRYQVTKGGTVSKDELNPDRPGLWKVCEVRFSYSDVPTAIGDDIVDGAKLFFPNPAKDYLNLDERVEAVQFYDISGKMVKESIQVNGGIEISELPAGLYLIKIALSNGSVKAEKLFKK